MKKQIISNTILFCFILIFVKSFEFLFGLGNTLVGVTLIIAILVLMGENLFQNPIKNLLIIILVNVSSGFFDYGYSVHY